MLKIQQFIMSKKFLPVLLVLTVASLFVAFKTQGRSGDNPKTKNEKILRNVGALLEQGHYSPKIINDSFSKLVLHRFVKDLDEDKSIFLQADIDSFAKYENRIDDEIHGAKLESFYAIDDTYTRRLNQPPLILLIYSVSLLILQKTRMYCWMVIN
jgi:carboxyl-terminal processing protease